MNSVNIVGRLTEDIKINKTKSDIDYTFFTVAVYDGKDKDGNSKTVFLNCVA
jgi:single-stranded DNA-binding protein